MIAADTDSDDPLAPLQAASRTCHIALGPRTGQKLLSLRTVARRDRKNTAQLCAEAHESACLYAAVRAASYQRKALERLCRYITYPSIANKHLLSGTVYDGSGSDPTVASSAQRPLTAISGWMADAMAIRDPERTLPSNGQPSKTQYSGSYLRWLQMPHRALCIRCTGGMTTAQLGTRSSPAVAVTGEPGSVVYRPLPRASVRAMRMGLSLAVRFYEYPLVGYEQLQYR